MLCVNTGLQPKLEVLPATQRALWPQLAGTKSLGFVLYGGTAIALRLGHRASVDFDFFSDAPLDEPQLRSALPFLVAAQTLQETEDTLTVLTPPDTSGERQIKLSFFGGIDFGRVGIPDDTADGVLQIASLDDLLATKLKVILQRVEAKDYCDIAAMLRAGVNLPHGLAAARVLFGNTFQPSECVKALTWFEGGDLHSVSIEDRNLLIRAASSIDTLPAIPRAASSLASP